jgi:hypothetical protein
VKFKKTSTQTFNLLREAHGEDALSRVIVFQWRKGFEKEGKVWKTTNDLAVRLRRKAMKNVQKVKTRARADRRLDTRMIAGESNIDKETVRIILTTDLNLWRIQIRRLGLAERNGTILHCVLFR